MRAAATRLYAERASTTLYVAFELGNSEWRLAGTPSLDQIPLVRTRNTSTVDRPRHQVGCTRSESATPRRCASRCSPIGATRTPSPRRWRCTLATWPTWRSRHP